MPDRPKLPYVDLRNFKGLYTKSSPDVLSAEQLRIAENCDFFKTYGAIAKIRGNAHVLAAIYQEDGVTQKIPWVEFYKTPDLNGQILRHTLIAAGTKIFRVESNGTLTTLATGRTKDLFHTADRVERFLYISNQDTDAVGRGDELIKYDGAAITKWGITPPGSEETVIDTFDDKDTFSSNYLTLTDENTASDATATTWDGTAVRLDKTVTGANTRISDIEKAYDFYVLSDTRDMTTSIANRVNFYTYIPRGQLTADSVNTSTFDLGEAAMAVWVGASSPIGDDYWKFYITIGDLVEGWNKINLDFTTVPTDRKGSFYPETEAVKGIKWDFRREAGNQTFSGITMDRLSVLNQGAPVGTPKGSGTFSGVYKYKVSYVSKYGVESNAGPATTGISTTTNASIDLTNIPTSSDAQVVKRNIYRTVANGSVFLYLDTIYNNQATIYTDTTTDGNLGAATPPAAGDFGDDNSPPPQGGIVKRWKKTLFLAGDPQQPQTLYYSEDNEPESFPLLNAFELDGKITAMYETYSNLIVETETGKWQVIGDNPDFSVDKVVDNMGCVGRRAAGTSRLVGYAVDRDGMRLFDGAEPTKISEPIRDKYDDLAKTNIELMHTIHSKTRNTILQFNPNTTSPIPTYDSIFAFMYSIDDPRAGYWTTVNPASEANLNFLDATEIEDSDGDFHTYVSGDDGMVYELFAEGSKNWVNASGNSYPIRTRFQTPYLRLGEQGLETEGATSRVRPRFIEVRLEKPTSMVWDVIVDSADGSSQEIARDSQTLSMSFGTNNSLIRQPLKNNFVAGEYIRVTLDNNEANTSCRVTGVRIYYHVYPMEGPILTVDNSASSP